MDLAVVYHGFRGGVLGLAVGYLGFRGSVLSLDFVYHGFKGEHRPCRCITWLYRGLTVVYHGLIFFGGVLCIMCIMALVFFFFFFFGGGGGSGSCDCISWL